MKEKLPYIFYGSEPIGPIALRLLELAKYPPVCVIDNPKMPLEEQLDLIEEHKPTFILVVGFGAILKKEVIESVAGQVLNIHPSLLPEYRGPAPVVQAILDGATETGVTLMEIDSKMDHGPIIDQYSFTLSGKETPKELYAMLTEKGVKLFLAHIEDYLKEETETLPQCHDLATFTHFVKKEDGLLNLSDDVYTNERKIRAYQGWPRTWIIFREKILIIDKAHIEGEKLRFDLVQPSGKKIMTIKEYCSGIRISEEEFYKEIGL